MHRCLDSVIGYTLSFWANFTVPVGNGDFVYLSNGGHNSRSHGVAMTYGSSGRLEFIFKKPNGDEWRASASDVLPGRWHHIAASWSARNGLSLYINGDLISTTSVASRGQPVAVNASGGANDFVIGKSNEVTSFASGGRSMIMDEFNFWSMYKNITDIREHGQWNESLVTSSFFHMGKEKWEKGIQLKSAGEEGEVKGERKRRGEEEEDKFLLESK